MLESLTPGFDAWHQPDEREEADVRFALSRATAVVIECRREGLVEAAAEEVQAKRLEPLDAADEIVQAWETGHHKTLPVRAWNLARRLLAGEIEAVATLRGWFGPNGPAERGAGR